MPTVLIGPQSLRDQNGPYREILLAAGFDEFIEPPGGPQLTDDQLRAGLPGADAMIAGAEPMSAEMLDLAPRLRVIARTGVGYDTVDVAAATARRIAVTITPGTNHGSVAEQAFGLLLSITRDIVKNDRMIKAGGWDRNLVRPIRGQTLGLIGLGRIGRAMAARAAAFEMRLVAFDPVADPAFDARLGITRLGVEELLAVSDVVSLHLPLTRATLGLINRRTLALMRPGAILINTARGGLVDEADLYESVRDGHLAGAGLDVLCNEPPEPGNPLLTLDNVVISPHLGGIDTKGMADMAELAAQCIADLRYSRWPEGCVVNDELKAGWRW
jgi:phosphoglycerate dehydrogenase-like enzyme